MYYRMANQYGGRRVENVYLPGDKEIFGHVANRHYSIPHDNAVVFGERGVRQVYDHQEVERMLDDLTILWMMWNGDD